MSGLNLVVGGHRLEIQLNTWISPMEIVRHDGKVMSRKSSWLGTLHSFEVQEHGAPAKYEVKTFFGMSGVGCKVHRNGELLYETT
jgi:hypothetical protein